MWINPAHQRLRLSDLPCFQIHLGLQIELNILVVHGRPDILLHVVAAQVRVMVGFSIHLEVGVAQNTLRALHPADVRIVLSRKKVFRLIRQAVNAHPAVNLPVRLAVWPVADLCVQFDNALEDLIVIFRHMNQQVKIAQPDMGHIFVLPQPGADGLVNLPGQPVPRLASEQAVEDAEPLYFQADEGVLLRIFPANLLIPLFHPLFIVSTRHRFSSVFQNYETVPF